ncbi:PAS domain S-box protein [Cupriavidus basilensis]|uniref:Diguanylate cyclase/phosphodiesterase (GGDEF & EAL domains) with PAS/PAC sensor(S) n=1 Tax=Cupriavidus basilensis TaxID=68895 RepID=A0A0C4Y2U5_9BURK|nr:PAS domain S-box protein [Cupriavidus basilensis]AJG19502.1 diguanylate cyclase/phosphodiesterase (GGDEF & EAL domains) with PAS/PAC sensor(s) [Cupriavidus basilensis]
MDLLLDAICVVDRHGRFLSITGACESIFGYQPEEMLGKPMMDFVHPEERARTLQAVERIEAGYLQRHFENRYVRKDGSIARIMWSARLSECKNQRVAVASDISDQADALAEERLQSSEASAEAHWRLSATPPTLTPPGFPPIPLSMQDYTVLHALASGEACVTRKAIVHALGEDFLHYDQRRLDTQMRRLRRKVEQAGSLRLPVSTVRGKGFRVYQKIVIDR